MRATAIINNQPYDPNGRIILYRPIPRGQARPALLEDWGSGPVPIEQHRVLPTAPIGVSPKKVRRANSARFEVNGNPVAQYLETVHGMIIPCCWDINHSVVRTYCMPDVELHNNTFIVKV